MTNHLGKDTSSSAQQPDWIPRTKFYPPQVGEDILARPDLLKQLYRAVTQRRLTLISAPAGSGKTMTAASLASAFPDLPLAWLALDKDDNDPVTFARVIVLALQGLYPDCGRNALALLASLPNPGAELRRVTGVLINEVLATDPAPLAFVIDDYHLITETAIHEALTYLLERLPPGWHLVVATRRDPPLGLARLRARGQLAEFRLPELRFQDADVQALFRQRFSLPLSPAEIEVLQARTEGWVAGLRLLATTLQRITDADERRAFIRQFVSIDRHVFDLLAEEVLQRQPPELRTFLLRTSILRELTPHLCVAVTGRADAPRLLEEAYRNNLFLSAVGERDTVVGTAYRYHDLFAGFLRHQLQSEGAEQVAELHRRAAAAETTPERIVSHYLAAEAWQEACAAIEQYGPQLLQEGLIGRLQSWITVIPDSIRENRPRLNYLLGMCHSDRGDFVAAQPYLQSALEQFGREGDEKEETAALVALGYAALGRHDLQSAPGLLEQVLARPLSPYERVRALINRAWMHLYQDDWPQIDADTAAAMHIALTSEDRGAINVLAHQLRPPLLFGSRGIAPFEEYCRLVLAGIGDGVSVVHAGTYALLGTIQFLYGDLEKAVSTARKARQVSQQLGGFTWMDMDWDLILLTDALVRGDYAAFNRRWQARLPVYEGTALRQWLICYLYQQGRALWMQQRWDDLRQIDDQVRATHIDSEPPESHIARQMMAALLALHERRLRDAEKILQEAMAAQRHTRQSRLFFDARFLLAYLYHVWRRPEEAVAILRPLLATLAQDGTPGLILQEGRYTVPLLRLAIEHNVQAALVEQVLGQLSPQRASRPIPIPGSNETLTPREAEILRLIITGASNRAIADQLVISEWTVKSHVSRILRKLDVSSRTEAAARARELGIG